MADITFNDLSDTTESTISAKTGNFDELMKTVTLHLEEQFNAGRNTGNDYATVYLGALQSVLAQVVTFTLNMNKANKETDLLAQKEITEYAQTGTTSASTLPVSGSVSGKQITLFTEQAKGFKWNAENKYLKALLDAYSVNISVSKEDDTATAILLPSASTSSGIAKVIEDMKPSG